MTCCKYQARLCSLVCLPLWLWIRLCIIDFIPIVPWNGGNSLPQSMPREPKGQWCTSRAEQGFLANQAKKAARSASTVEAAVCMSWCYLWGFSKLTELFWQQETGHPTFQDRCGTFSNKERAVQMKCTPGRPLPPSVARRYHWAVKSRGPGYATSISQGWAARCYLDKCKL